jgi:hypothetical protein
MRDADLIVVNKTLLDFPNAKYFISMDANILRHMKKDFANFGIPTKIFVLNMVKDGFVEKNGQFHYTNTNQVFEFSPFDVLIKSRRESKFGLSFRDFAHGRSSGFCALQLALILGYKEINLVGFDFVVGEKTHHHEGYGYDSDFVQQRLNEHYRIFEASLLDLLLNTSVIRINTCSRVGKLYKLLPYREI